MKKTVQLYVNVTKIDAMKLATLIQEELMAQGYEVVADKADIVIGLGGDGTLLHFLRKNNYETTAKYIGVNCGTLGFLQDFNVTCVKEFVSRIPSYIEQTLKFVAVEVEVEGKKMVYKALNELTIQNAYDKAFKTTMSIGAEFLENFTGTGLIISTPTGSTALSLSAGGTILHPNIEAIQITPREAIANSKMHCLSKSICIPKDFDVVLESDTRDFVKIYSDGERVYEGPYDKIRIYYSNEGISKLKDEKDNFIKTIREKLI